jgi:hypothetical protein
MIVYAASGAVLDWYGEDAAVREDASMAVKERAERRAV